jgi:hypothetical protein
MSDTQTEKRIKQGGGRAFHSRLEPFVELIREQRQKRRTWKEIAELLRTKHGCPITFQGVHQFYRRYVKRQARPHWEQETGVHPVPPSVEPSRSPVLASTPPARPFKAPNPDSIKLNDPTTL